MSTLVFNIKYKDEDYNISSFVFSTEIIDSLLSNLQATYEQFSCKINDQDGYIDVYLTKHEDPKSLGFILNFKNISENLLEQVRLHEESQSFRI